ncbi:MAG: PLP-dependent aminotransferase family protein [Synergistaceae bacterium]|jgi:2-aminoadipate transaminase|nr:PLP-dependent aminotransferase family protein [Synergistaceae bacterium]
MKHVKIKGSVAPLAGVLSGASRERLGKSGIGEMISLIERYEAISFGAGEPSPDLFPREEIAEAIANALGDADVWGYYHDDYGDEGLRDWIASRMKADGIAPEWVDAGNILLTNGGGEAMSLVTAAFVDPGSVVLVESPTYTESLLAFRAAGAFCLPVPSDGSGIIPEKLAGIVSSVPARFLYTIPNYQNPSGRTMPRERRVEVLEILCKAGIGLVEDDPYHYLGYDGDPPESFLALADDDVRVIHCSSFSKTIAPGLRVGWAVIPPYLSDIFGALRVSSGLGRPLAIQRGILRYLESIDFGDRISFLRTEYRKRRDEMALMCGSYLSPLGIRTNLPDGGFFVWGEVSPSYMNNFSSSRFARWAVEEERVGIIPGTAFYPSGGGENAFRMSYAKIRAGDIGDGVKRLARAFEKYRNLSE